MNHLLISLCLVLAAWAELTIPIHHMRQTHKSTRMHHLSETYPLKTSTTLFMMSLKINQLPYDLVLDTGSSDFFIKGDTIRGSPSRKFKCGCDTSKTIVLGYLDGDVRTHPATASIQLGTNTFNSSVLVAFKMDSLENLLEGVIGLSFQEQAEHKAPNFMNTLIGQKIIDNHQFGLFLNLNKGKPSYVTLGGFNKSLIKQGQELYYLDIVSNSKHKQYKTRVDHIMIGDLTFTIQQAIFDSGNTCISFPAKFSPFILRAFNVNNNNCYWSKQENPDFDRLYCKIVNFDTLPTIAVGYKDKIFDIPKQYYINRCSTRDRRMYHCQTLIEVVRGFPEIFLGATFIQRFYTVFDVENKRIGIAKNINNFNLVEILRRRY